MQSSFISYCIWRQIKAANETLSKLITEEKTSRGVYNIRVKSWYETQIMLQYSSKKHLARMIIFNKHFRTAD